MKLSENQQKNLYISKLNSKVLDVINRTVQKKNYDYCTAGVTRMQFFLNGKRLLSVVKENPREEPYRYNDFKFMRCGIKDEVPLMELAKAVDVALELIIKNSGSLIDLYFDFIIF